MADNSRNPRNPGSDLFRSLTKIFSGPIVSRRSQTGRRLRRHQLDKYGTRFRSASGQQFKRSGHFPFSNMNNAIMINHNRSERYVDFDQMEYTPEIASALDIYADEMTTHSALTPMLNIKCSNEEIKAILHSLYHDILNIDFNLFGWCRTMCKYGDFFLYLDIDEQKSITNVIGLPSHEVERLEGEDKSNPNYVQFQWNSGGMTFENWQIAHFRILGNDKYAPYGTSVLEPSRRIWRQLNLLEDAMMAYRIVRAPDRRVFKIDVGGIPPNEVEQYMQKVMTSMKRSAIVDENTGRVDLRYNPLSVEEDYYIPVRGTTSTDIVPLAGGSYTGDIDDVKYLRDKLFAALKIPAAYFSRAEGTDEDKTTLAQKDIRFARTVQRLQRAVVSELEKIGIVQLYLMGFKGDDLTNFSLSLNNPSKIAEMQELEHWNQKFTVAGQATEGFFSRRWIAEHLFNMSHEEFLRNQRELFYDRTQDAQLAAVAEAMQEEAAGLGGGLGDDLGGDLGGDLGDDLGGDLSPDPTPTPDTPASPDAPAGDTPAGGDDVLLASPGQGALQEKESGATRTLASGQTARHGEEYTRPGWRGATSTKSERNKHRVKWLKRVGTQTKPEVATRRTTRAKFPGISSMVTAPSLTFEEKETSYNDDAVLQENENKIFTTQYEIDKLIRSLEKKTDETQTQ